METNNETSINLSSEQLSIGHLAQRNDTYIPISKKELKMFNSTDKTLDTISQVVIALASGLLGMLLTKIPNFDVFFWFAVILASVLFIIGIWLKLTSRSMLDELMELCSDNQN